MQNIKAEKNTMMETDDNKVEFGRYEKRLLLLLLISTIPNSFSSFQFLSTHYTPNFHCSSTVDSSALGESSTLTNGLLNNRSVVQGFFNDTSLNQNVCLHVNNSGNQANNSNGDNNRMLPCKSFQFENDVNTVISEFQLVCDKAWLKPTLTSLYMGGKMFGAMLGGFVSDRFGRRFGFLFFTALQFIFSLLTSFASSIPMYIILIFCSGMTGVANFEIAAVMGSEMVSYEKRGLNYFCCEMGFAIGYVILSLMNYLFTSWRWFLVFGGLVGFIYIPYYWLIDETPSWLLATGQNDRAKKILQKIAKYNGRNANLDARVSLIEKKCSENSSTSTVWSTVVQLSKDWRLIFRLFVVIFSWCITSLTYYVTTLNNDALSGNRYLNVFYGSLTEVLSGVIFYFFVTRLGRRKCYMSFMFIASIAVIAIPFLDHWNGTAAMVMNMLTKLSVAVAFCVLFLYTHELFPTHIRTSVLALSSAMSRIGSIMAPFVIYANESAEAIAPSIGIGVTVFISALSYILLPETKKAKLPQTIEDAKNLDRRQQLQPDHV